MLLLQQVYLDRKVEDSFVWCLNNNGRFTVKSLCLEMYSRREVSVPDAMRKVWKGLVPHRIEVFVWLVILEKVNTKNRLIRVEAIQPDQGLYVLCNEVEEDSNHLFLHCGKARDLWN